MSLIRITDEVSLQDDELEEKFIRSSGPGGQNVNKVSTKAVLRWSVSDSPTLPGAVRARFVDKFGSRLTKEGDLILQSQRFRDQSSNAEDCLQRLRDMLLQVAKAPTKRRPSRRTRGSVERRLQNKKANSARKQSRRRPTSDD